MYTKRAWVGVFGAVFLLSAPALADGVRDPFRPFMNPLKKGGCEVQDTRPDIRSLKLVAVITGAGHRHAVLEDAAQTATMVTPGTEIRTGQSVAQIASDHIAVEETFAGPRGETRVMHERWLDPEASRPLACSTN